MILNLLQLAAAAILGGGLLLLALTWREDQRMKKSARFGRCLLCLHEVEPSVHAMQMHSWRFHNGAKPGMARIEDQ